MSYNTRVKYTFTRFVVKHVGQTDLERSRVVRLNRAAEQYVVSNKLWATMICRSDDGCVV